MSARIFWTTALAVSLALLAIPNLSVAQVTVGSGVGANYGPTPNDPLGRNGTDASGAPLTGFGAVGAGRSAYEGRRTDLQGRRGRRK